MAGAGPGPLALIGGDELKPGNEPQDRILVEAAGSGRAFVLATAAGRQHPEQVGLPVVDGGEHRMGNHQEQ